MAEDEPKNEFEYNRREMRKYLMQTFSASELMVICFDLDLDYEEFSSEKKVMVIDLLRHLERNEKLHLLIDWIKREKSKYFIARQSLPLVKSPHPIVKPRIKQEKSFFQNNLSIFVLVPPVIMIICAISVFIYYASIRESVIIALLFAISLIVFAIVFGFFSLRFLKRQTPPRSLNNVSVHIHSGTGDNISISALELETSNAFDTSLLEKLLDLLVSEDNLKQMISDFDNPESE